MHNLEDIAQYSETYRKALLIQTLERIAEALEKIEIMQRMNRSKC